MLEIFIRYIHFIGIFFLAAMLVSENVILSKRLSRKDFVKLIRIDGLYGLSAMVTLIAGLLLWLWVGKPSEFYSDNPVFHAKIGIFIFVALLSFVPTAFFAKNRNNTQSEIEVPGYVLLIARVEVVFLLILPALAVLMARGYGAM